MSVYLGIIIGIILIPLLLSFESRVAFYRRYRSLFPAIILTGIIFLVWDVAATARGDWAFNEHFILGIRYFGIPLEEVLFFIVAPYSCLFIYDVICRFVPDRQMNLPKAGLWLSILGLVITAIFNVMRPYTFTVAIFCAGTIVCVRFFGKNLFLSRQYWLFLFISLVPFLISNYLLTSIPVVTYNEHAFLGRRLLTIPAEDFFYHFALLTLNLKLYLLFRGEQ